MCPNYHKVGDTAAAPLVPTNAAALPVFATVQCTAVCSVASLWHSEVGGCQSTVGCSAQFFARKWENNVKASVKNCAAYTAKVNLKSG